jgi:hypothetical protein
MRIAALASLAGSQLAETRDVCALFNKDEEERGVLLSRIKNGFQCGHKAVHVVNPDQRSDILRQLTAAAIGLQHERNLAEERRVAKELDERLAERTAELAAANERLERSESESRLVAGSIPGGRTVPSTLRGAVWRNWSATRTGADSQRGRT